MEQHPVPRNITGFQFRLIGDMTIKQFGYLLGGSIIGIIIFKLPLPNIITWPAALLFILTGIGFAFIPIQERPLDRWFIAYIKSVYSPTEFIWRKTNEPPDILYAPAYSRAAPALTQKHQENYEDSRAKLNAYLAKMPKKAHQTIDLSETNHLRSALSLFSNANHPQINIPYSNPFVQKAATPQPRPKPAINMPPPTMQPPQTPNPVMPVTPPSNPVNKTNLLDEEITKVKEEILHEQHNQAKEQQLEIQLQQLMAEKEVMKKQLDDMQKMLNQQSVVKPTVFKDSTDQQSAETVKIITPNVAKDSGFPNIPQEPNTISGIIKDINGNLLPNILVTIKDAEKTPVRALKSNKLGQFAAITPLPRGTYNIECEDPQKKYTFAIIEITLTDDRVTPLEILAKTQREVQREKLMQEIFGQTK